MKHDLCKELNWPKACRDVLLAVVAGWIIFSLAQCTARCKEAEEKTLQGPGIHIR